MIGPLRHPLGLALMAMLCFLCVIAPLPPPVRTPAAFALLFVLPGVALLAAVGIRPADVVTTLVGLGAGTACVLLAVMLIGLSPLPLTSPVLAATVTGLIVAAAIRAQVRAPVSLDRPTISGSLASVRQRLVLVVRRAGAFLHPFRPPGAFRRPMVDVRGLAASNASLGVLAAIVFVAAFAVAWAPTASGTGAASSPLQLWIVPAPGGAAVGVYNGAPDPRDLRIVVQARGVSDGLRLIDAAVGPGATWQQYLAFPASWSEVSTVDVSLFRVGDQTRTLRSVRLDVGPLGPG